MLQLLCEERFGVFCRAPKGPLRAAKRFIERYAAKVDFHNTQAPSTADIGNFFETSRNSMSGPDDIPNALWLAAGVRAWNSIHRMATWLYMGFSPDLGVNQLLKIFIAKGNHPDDDERSRVRKAKDTIKSLRANLTEAAGL